MRRGKFSGSDSAFCPQLHDSLWRVDRGSATLLGIGIISALMTMLVALGTAFSFALGLVKLQLTSDAAALIAADTLVGAVAGYPCENAEALTIRNGASLTTCRIVGLVVEVSTTTSLGPFQVSRWAKAG